MFGQVLPGESPPDVAEAVCETEQAPKPFSSLTLLISSCQAEQSGQAAAGAQEAGDPLTLCCKPASKVWAEVGSGTVLMLR